MIQLSPVVLLALGELLLISMAAALGLAVAGLVRKSRERRAVAKLIRRIKEDEARRRAETHNLMQENYGFEDQQLESIVNRITREEKRFYQALINLFLRRDVNLMEVLHVECEGVTEPYRTLEIPRSDPDQDDNLQSDLATQVEVLREENERLTTELGVTMDTMGTMLTEYASMYSGGEDKTQDREESAESLSSSEKESDEQVPTPSMLAEGALPEMIGAQGADSGDMVIEKEKIAETGSDQDDAANLDFDIGEILGDETLVIEGMDDPSALSDETQVVNVADDELVELDDEDLDLENNSPGSGVATDSDDKQKWAG